MTDQAVRPGPPQFLPTSGSAEAGPERTAVATRDVVFNVEQLSFYYGKFRALHNITLGINRNEITALIGPSGCGKTTLLRCLNRMNDLVPDTRMEGEIRYRDVDLYGPSIRPIELRRKVGMVFQKPNPFPKSIWENVAFAPRANGVPRNEIDNVVEQSLRAAALWDEVKDKLKQSAFTLSGGQQQRLCIARAIAVTPDVILMDEPAASLDPIATSRIEDLMVELVTEYTIVIVTHNLQQASRASHRTAFLTMATEGTGGELVEIGPTAELFTSPSDPRTEGYITGRFG